MDIKLPPFFLVSCHGSITFDVLKFLIPTQFKIPYVLDKGKITNVSQIIKHLEKEAYFPTESNKLKVFLLVRNKNHIVKEMYKNQFNNPIRCNLDITFRILYCIKFLNEKTKEVYFYYVSRIVGYEYGYVYFGRRDFENYLKESTPINYLNKLNFE